MPKGISKKFNYSLSLLYVYPVTFFKYLSAIIVWPIAKVFHYIGKLFSKKKEEEEVIDEDVLTEMVEQIQENGDFEEDEAELVKNAIDLSDIEISGEGESKNPTEGGDTVLFVCRICFSYPWNQRTVVCPRDDFLRDFFCSADGDDRHKKNAEDLCGNCVDSHLSCFVAKHLPLFAGVSSAAGPHKPAAEERGAMGCSCQNGANRCFGAGIQHL